MNSNFNPTIELTEIRRHHFFAKLLIDRQDLLLKKDDTVYLIQKHTFKSKQVYYVELQNGQQAFIDENELDLLPDETHAEFPQINGRKEQALENVFLKHNLIII